MAYNLDPICDSYCYPETTVLANKLGITDEFELQKAEAAATFVRAAEIEKTPITGAFDFEHYKSVHRFLFSDLYNWAGEIRTVNISKKGTFFCPFEQIDEYGGAIFKRLKKLNFLRKLNGGDFISEIVDFYVSTNQLHPFREGNGRTQRSFLTMLIRSAGRGINFSEVDGDMLMIATIQSAQGVNDLLYNIFSEAVEF